MALQDRIAVATRHVETGREIYRSPAPASCQREELLVAFERSQSIFESDLADLLMKEREQSSNRWNLSSG